MIDIENNCCQFTTDIVLVYLTLPSPLTLNTCKYFFEFFDDDDGLSLVGSAIPEVENPPGVIPASSPDLLGFIAPPNTSPVVSTP